MAAAPAPAAPPSADAAAWLSVPLLALAALRVDWLLQLLPSRPAQERLRSPGQRQLRQPRQLQPPLRRPPDASPLPRPPAARLHSRPPLPAHLAGPTQVVAQVCPRRKGEQEVQGIKDAVDGCLQQGQESGATNRREESRTRQHGGAVRRGQRAPAVTGAMGVQESGETCAKLPPMAGSLADCLGGGRLPDCPTCPCASVCWR